MSLLTRRVAASFIDFCVIALYACVLFVVTMLVRNVLDADLRNVSPLRGQVAGFLTLTLPVFLYFVLYEKSRYNATPGKRLLGLRVASPDGRAVEALVIRNLLKLLPWEISHAGVHWTVFLSNQGEPTPVSLMALLIVPQVVAVIYFVSIVANSSRSLYDRMAGTKVVTSVASQLPGRPARARV